MIEHTYSFRAYNSTWWVCVKIFAEYVDCNSVNLHSKTIKIADGLWMKFADKPMKKGELFYDGDLPHLKKGLEIVQKQIINSSIYENTLIIIHSLEIIPCDFQEEGLIAVMIEWAAKAFNFEPPKINVVFQKQNNRYVFDFSDSEK